MKNLAFIEAIRHISTFNQYKRAVMEGNRDLPAYQKSPGIWFYCRTKLYKWGMNISWFKLSRKFRKGGSGPAQFVSDYIAPNKKTLNVSGRAFTGVSDEDKEFILNIPEKAFTDLRVKSKALSEIGIRLTLISEKRNKRKHMSDHLPWLDRTHTFFLLM